MLLWAFLCTILTYTHLLTHHTPLHSTPPSPSSPLIQTGFRERLLADPSFMVKMGIEVGIGICTKCTAEYTKRQGTFSKVRCVCVCV